MPLINNEEHHDETHHNDIQTETPNNINNYLEHETPQTETLNEIDSDLTSSSFLNILLNGFQNMPTNNSDEIELAIEHDDEQTDGGDLDNID